MYTSVRKKKATKECGQLLLTFYLLLLLGGQICFTDLISSHGEAKSRSKNNFTRLETLSDRSRIKDKTWNKKSSKRSASVNAYAMAEN
jgi:hypothetical protein